VSDTSFTRREFVSVGLTALGGLAIGIRIGPARRSDRSSIAAPNAFVRIEPDSTVVVVVPRPEMGQGARTAIAMLVAD
jgi:isoquinoline 1-oxidoreductase beta subunit